MQKFWDCFLFYNELALLEIRLNELSPYIDKFVLAESTHTFSGKPKRLYYDEVKDNAVFAPFKDKIIHRILDEKSDADGFILQNNQRVCIDIALRENGAQPDDLIIVSDVDEIIDTKVFSVIAGTYIPAKLWMKLYYYYFNCRGHQVWMAPAFCRYRNYKTATILRCGNYHPIIIRNAGWHYSYLSSVDGIIEKLDALSHDELSGKGKYVDAARIKRCMKSCTDLLGRTDHSYHIEPLDGPVYLMDNKEKFKEFIRGVPQEKSITKIDIINHLINSRNNRFKRYLEIGLGNTENFAQINCAYKAGVDPNIDCKYNMSSDAFFESYTGEKFDIIFIDGLHTARQSKKDVENALNLINPKGFVLLHDCNPTSEGLQYQIEMMDKNLFSVPGWCKILWCGDVWKTWAELRMTRPDLSMYTIDVGFGIGVIKKGVQKLFPKKMFLDYAFLDANRKELINLTMPVMKTEKELVVV